MAMQDKEFDAIFNSKFEDFEVEPSTGVWSNIAGELDGKKKAVILPWLSIAATVLVLLTAGVLFLQRGKSTDSDKPKNNLVANHIEPTVTPVTKEDRKVSAVTQPVSRLASVPNHQTIKVSRVNKITVPVDYQPADVEDVQPVKTENEQVQLIAAVRPSHADLQTTVPNADIALAPKVGDVVAQTKAERPIVMAAAETETIITTTTTVKKNRIHNLGGLINVLVAKVDKREDKLIEFSDNDDDDANANVTGVNLGIIKVKKQQ